MAAGRQHITLEGFSKVEGFAPKGTARNSPVPFRDRSEHGGRLTAQYDVLMHTYRETRAQAAEPITEEIGVYVEITGFPQIKLPLDSLDTRDFKLRSCRTTDDEREVALVFIPEERRP